MSDHQAKSDAFWKGFLNFFNEQDKMGFGLYEQAEQVTRAVSHRFESSREAARGAILNDWDTEYSEQWEGVRQFMEHPDFKEGAGAIDAIQQLRLIAQGVRGVRLGDATVVLVY